LIFKGSTSSFRGEVKLPASCHKVLWHVNPLKLNGNYMYQRLYSSAFCICGFCMILGVNSD
jgi:hypothetical protein